MRATLIILGILVCAVVVVKVLGSTLGAPEYERTDLGITGPLALDAKGRMLESREVWKEPRDSHSREDRERLFVDRIGEGEVFQVTNHARKGSQVWVEISARDGGLTGWVHSPSDDPVRAEVVRK